MTPKKHPDKARGGSIDSGPVTPATVFGDARRTLEQVLNDTQAPARFEAALFRRPVTPSRLRAVMGEPDSDVEVVEPHLRAADDVEDVLDLVGPTGPAGPPPLVTVNLSSCEADIQRATLARMLQTWPGAHLLEPSQATVAVRFGNGHRPQLTVVFSVKAVCRQRMTTVPSTTWVIDPALLSKGFKP